MIKQKSKILFFCVCRELRCATVRAARCWYIEDRKVLRWTGNIWIITFGRKKVTSAGIRAFIPAKIFRFSRHFSHEVKL